MWELDLNFLRKYYHLNIYTTYNISLSVLFRWCVKARKRYQSLKWTSLIMTIYKGQNNMKLSHITLMMKPHNIFVPFPFFQLNFVLFLCASCVCAALSCPAVAVTLKGIGKWLSDWLVVVSFLYFWEGCLWKYSPL